MDTLKPKVLFGEYTGLDAVNHKIEARLLVPQKNLWLDYAPPTQTRHRIRETARCRHLDSKDLLKAVPSELKTELKRVQRTKEDKYTLARRIELPNGKNSNRADLQK